MIFHKTSFMTQDMDIDTSKKWSAIWPTICKALEDKIVPHQLQTWIYPLCLLQWHQKKDEDEIFLAAPNDFSAQWIRENYHAFLQDTCKNVLQKECKIIIQTAEQKPQNDDFLELQTFRLPEERQRHLAKKDSGKKNSLPKARPESDGLESRYVFENFVVGASNQFAHASAIAVADHPGKQYNPLFLYSSPGLGKTHLLHAIGNRLLQAHSSARVLYISAERFVNELIESLQHRRMSHFRSKYRDSFDLLLIDDIQFIAGKNTSEEEFFHTFNALYSSKRQIIVTSDRPPKEIEGLAERVRTRFEWGLIADISPPEIETRIAILKTKAEQDDVYLPDEVAIFLATHVKSNVRELEGLLIRLQAQASLSGAEISIQMAEQEIKNCIGTGNRYHTVESIQNIVSKHFKLKMNEFKSSSRNKNVVLPRQIAIYLTRKYTNLGLKEIGKFFGGKDHTTILHACQKIEKFLQEPSEIKSAVESIQNLL